MTDPQPESPSLHNGDAQENDTTLRFHEPTFGPEELNAVREVLESGWVTGGPKVDEFERAFARRVDVAGAAATSSCTTAMHLALVALGVGPGDEVIVPTFTFAATASVVVHAGAVPILVDVDPLTLNIDPDAVRKALTPRTRAIIAVDYGGHPAPLDALLKICEEAGIPLIEDAAHSLGAEFRGRPVGSIATATCFSFYGTKNITTGDGGMFTSQDVELVERVRLLRNHAITKDSWRRYGDDGAWKYDVVDAGFKCNLTDLQAAIGLVQLQRLDGFQERREALADRYASNLGHIPGIRFLKTLECVRHARHLYPVLLDPDALTISRASFSKEMQGLGIQTSVHFIPLHLQTYYRERWGYEPGVFPVAESAYDRLLTLPIYPKMSEDDADRVADAVATIAERYAAN